MKRFNTEIDMEAVQAQAAANERTRVASATMIEHARQAIYERWLDAAVESGQLTLPDYETMPERYKAVQWHPRGLELGVTVNGCQVKDAMARFWRAGA